MPANEKEPHLWALEHDEQQLALAPRPASLQAALF